MTDAANRSDAKSAAAERRSLASVCVPKSTRDTGTIRHEVLLAPAVLSAPFGGNAENLLVAAWTLVVARLTGEERIHVKVDATVRAIDVDEDAAPLAFMRAVAQAASGDADGIDGHWDFAGAGVDPDGIVSWSYSATRPMTVLASSAVLDKAVLSALGDLLQKMIEQLSSANMPAIRHITVLTNSQAARLLKDWNDTRRNRSPADTVHALFSEQARKTPDSVAIEFGNVALTYAIADRRSSAWAAQLRANGVAAGSIVAVLLPRSADSIVALLAILKAGGVYLPLDEAYPVERLRFMLQDSGASLVLTATPRAPEFVPPGMRTLRIDELADAAPAASPAQSGSDLAYIMYTSGSTGTPKGVEIPHAAIIRLVRDADYVTLGTDVAFLHAAPLGFDASTLEIWGPLLNGGRCVVHDEVIPTGPGLAATIGNHAVTSAWLTAALFNAVVDDDPLHLQGLKELLIGGEALSVPHVHRAYRALAGTQIINGYGPTESTTFAATYRIPRELPAEAPSVPIGRPISDTTLYILNRRMQPVPVGFLGELFIGGAGLARGYRNRPALTAERFVAGAFGSDRLYKTGDLVRHRIDGHIEFVGRADGQVKIRGYRIETGEVESALRLHASVRSCAVVVREDRPGDKRLVAYVVPAGAPLGVDALREHLAINLPEFMRPSAYVALDALPITANGKLDRRALPAPTHERPELAQEYRAPANDVQARICEIFGAVLDLKGVGTRDNFFELGGNSLLALRAIAALRDAFKTTISTTAFFQQPTAEHLAAIVTGTSNAPQIRSRRTGANAASTAEPVAIIGMAGRFPGADDVEQFWTHLCEGKESITFFADAQLDPSVPAALRADPSYVKARGILNGVDMFDAAFFGIGPKEAELMDPQQRKFLEICWECLEHGGYAPDACAFPVGVFAGMYNATYYQKHVMHRPELVDKVGEFQVMLANEKDYIATRVAHRLNLTGPAISVHTACSTSLVAICQAFDALRNGQCDMALAGGVSILCPPNSGYLYQEGAMLSPDGHTRSFDADAQGTVFSDGAAVVLLKRLSDAVADRDTIYAVIRGAGVNNDGGQKASFTAPSATAQADVIAFAQDCAGVDPRSISYVETHGTATPLGDPIEIEGMTRAFRRGTQDSGFCAIGSVKSNAGHLVIAAGATGLIKTALALRNAVIPPSINFRAHNAKIDFASTPFYVNAKLTQWKSDGAPRRAGVSAFGVGGTNAHVVVEEAPQVAPAAESAPPYLMMLSARSEGALASAAERLASHLRTHDDMNAADVAHTLRVGRKAFQHRGFAVAASTQDAVAAFSGTQAARFIKKKAQSRAPDVAFMFPGQGAQYVGMGSTLYRDDAVYRAAFDECAESLLPHAGFDLREQVFKGSPESLQLTAVTQPAMFAIEYCTSQFWLSRGLKPVALVGHSIGEFVAAVLAGVMSLQDALRLIAHRGRLMQAQPSGSMLSIRAPAAQVRSRLPDGVCIAAENSPLVTVAAGPAELIETFRAALDKDGIANRVLQTSHAFHSSMMDAVVPVFEAEVRKAKLSPPAIPIASTLTGTWLQPSQATDPAYWSRHLREAVLFSPALRTMTQDSSAALLEVGPRNTLATLARQHFTPKQPGPEIVASLADTPENEAAALANAIGSLWACGIEIDTRPLNGEPGRRRVALPSYPFERKRFWVEARCTAQVASAEPIAQPVQEAIAPAVVPAAVPPSEPVITPIQEQQILAEHAMPSPVTSRRDRFIGRLRALIDEVVGVDLEDADPTALFVELGLDSLSLTQIATQLQKTFSIKITFRQLMETYSTLGSLAEHLDALAPKDAVPAPAPAAAAAAPAVMQQPAMVLPAMNTPRTAGAAGPPNLIQQVIEQQMQLMAQQLALLSGAGIVQSSAPVTAPPPLVVQQPVAAQAPAAAAPAPAAPASDDESAGGPMKYDVKKAFGAIARIHTKSTTDLTPRQKARLDTFMRRYIARTQKSKEYTVKHRPHLADPRVVNGFRPQLKEIIYQIVVERSKGPNVWDLDGNPYIDVLNGFGMNLFGWQPQFVVDAVLKQIDLGYEIGPQHPLAGEVADLICQVTGFDRAGLCNTGSEAVMGAVRIARTVTGRTKIALFTGSYHGIFDEVIVRGTKKLRAVPAAPGIMPNTAENVLVLDYGTPESLEILRTHADELAAVLIEPVQSRRPDFQPREFLKELREITRNSGTLFIFDEVVTGFRAHPRGAQAVLGIDADLCTYGKVVGGGFPIGVIAGKREFMDALDGGGWQYGDDSIPTVGVTYFAGTFVRHPLALAAAKAVLLHLKENGAPLQESLNARTTAMAQELNAFCEEVGAPIVVKNFGSVWKTFFTEDHPLQDLLFAMMRDRGIHILDNFPCFFTTAHKEADFAAIVNAFKESVRELQEADFLPRRASVSRALLDATKPPVPGARLGKDADGKPAWFLPNPDSPGKFLKVSG
jgi:amino acid adenylation domain-containing protein